jgi:predicted dehydrogenase
MTGGEIGFGAVGCGGFGLFALQHLVQVPGVRLVGVTDVSPEAASRASDLLGVEDAGGMDALLAHDDIDAVYLATPPFLHHDQAMRALAAGKHVICEKPLAVEVGDGEEMIAAARDRDRLMVTDFMQRYNPVFNAVAALLHSGALGQLLHGSFENLASDENLPRGHWFWDRAKSGGIFVEHGVHFFDLFAGWLGAGRVEAAQVGVRPGSHVEEQVGCSVRYRDGAWVDFYHGFHQARQMDRQTLRLIFEHGDVTLLDWIPVRVRVHALISESASYVLAELFPGGRLDVLETYSGARRGYRSRGEERDAYQMVDMAYGDGELKMRRYGEVLRAMFADQTEWIRDHDHRRRVTEANGYDALVTAHEADRLAHLNMPGIGNRAGR